MTHFAVPYEWTEVVEFSSCTLFPIALRASCRERIRFGEVMLMPAVITEVVHLRFGSTKFVDKLGKTSDVNIEINSVLQFFLYRVITRQCNSVRNKIPRDLLPAIRNRQFPMGQQVQLVCILNELALQQGIHGCIGEFVPAN
jgi:hypothetical protein